MRSTSARTDALEALRIADEAEEQQGRIDERTNAIYADRARYDDVIEAITDSIGTGAADICKDYDDAMHTLMTCENIVTVAKAVETLRNIYAVAAERLAMKEE